MPHLDIACRQAASPTPASVSLHSRPGATEPVLEPRRPEDRIQTGIQATRVQRRAEIAGRRVRDHPPRVSARGEEAADEVGDRERLRPRHLDRAVRGRLRGYVGQGGRHVVGRQRLHGGVGRRISPSPFPAIPPRNSKNCVARTIVNGTPPASISPSWWTLARMYPPSVMRSAPTTDRATWCPTPAVFSAASR